MKTNLKCQLLYFDTDSLLYEFKSEDLYRKISEKKTIWMNLTCQITRRTTLSAV